jgi:NADPH2:quinone reductase
LFATTRNDGDVRADLPRHRSHALVLLSREGSLFLTRPVLFEYIGRRDAPEASSSELLEGVASGKVRIDVNQRFALKDAAEAHKTFEARATSASTILTI